MGCTASKNNETELRKLRDEIQSLAFDPVAFKKTKHILRAAEFLRDLVSRGVISVEHLPGVVMIADLLTKAVSRAIFTGLIKQLDDFHAL